MKIIKQLANHIREELCDAQKYAKCAVKVKQHDQQLGDLFYKLSKEQIHHADEQYEHAVRMIKQQKQHGTEIPTAMAIVWDWQHEHMIDDKARINALLEMYKQ